MLVSLVEDFPFSCTFLGSVSRSDGLTVVAVMVEEDFPVL